MVECPIRSLPEKANKDGDHWQDCEMRHYRITADVTKIDDWLIYDRRWRYVQVGPEFRFILRRFPRTDKKKNMQTIWMDQYVLLYHWSWCASIATHESLRWGGKDPWSNGIMYVFRLCMTFGSMSNKSWACNWNFHKTSGHRGRWDLSQSCLSLWFRPRWL